MAGMPSVTAAIWPVHGVSRLRHPVVGDTG
jgi:hypothetical protein